MAGTDLVDRLSGESTEHIPSRPRIVAHLFTGYLGMYMDGTITGAQAVQDLDLQGDELTQAQALISVIDGKNALQKVIFLLRVDGVVLCLQTDGDTLFHTGGVVNKADVIAALELT